MESLEVLNNWNFFRDIDTGRWYWNPDATEAVSLSNVQEIPAGELITLTRNRHIDYPSIAIYLRASMGERNWARFVERYGIPPIILEMPPDVPDGLRDEFKRGAENIHRGGSGTVPSGTKVTYADGGKGLDPFSKFLDHNVQQIVLMATGGTLTSLTGSTGIGQGATGAHEETWRAIVARDSVLVATAINKVVSSRLLAAAFPGKPALADFAFETDAKKTPGEIFDIAAKAKAAGYRVAKDDLESRTGYKLELDAPEAQEPSNQEPKKPEVNADLASQLLARDMPPDNTVAKPLQNASNGGDEVKMGEDAPREDKEVLGAFKAFRGDLLPVVEKLAGIITASGADEGRFKAALADFATYLETFKVENPKLAEEFERILAEAYVSGVQESGSSEVQNGDAEKNAKAALNSDECRAKDPSKCPTHGAGGTVLSPKENHAKGKAAWAKAVSSKADVVGAMNRESVGDIDFLWGKEGTAANKYEDGYGVSKILKKHPGDAAQIPGVIAFGDIYEDPVRDKFYVVKDKRVAVLGKIKGKNSYLVTGFKSETSRYVKELRSSFKLLEKGEG